jgi:alpha-mannosidase
MAGRLPAGYLTQAEDAGSILIEAGDDRQAIVADVLDRIGHPLPCHDAEAEAVAQDYLALGTGWWWLRDLATAMGHGEGPDRSNLTRELFLGGSAWVEGDVTAARNRLRAAFEVLTQSRERFYPVDAYIVDLCLLDPALPKGSLDDPLSARTPVTFLAPARAIEAQASLDPEGVARLRDAITEGWADVVGGAYAEVDEPLLPLESILWQFRRGGEVYQEHLDGRNVETVARRRFGLYTQLPQVAKRFGFRFGYHMGFDTGKFPVRPEAKRLWESPDHSNLESLMRPPLAADSALAGLRLPWRLALTMKDDHVATLPLAHWPSPVCGWYRDLRRIASYSPVVARCVTFNDYFHLTDRPYETFSTEPDSYVSPYLAQAVARKDPTPVSGRAAHARLRTRLDALTTAHALAEGLGTAPTAPTPDAPHLAMLEQAIETGDFETAGAGLDRLEQFWAEAVARGLVGAGTGGRPGYLVVNPVGIARRVPVRLSGAATDLRPEGPLRAAQPTDEGVWAVVDLPAFGFAWIPRASDAAAAAAPVGAVSVRDRVLRNESIAVEIDAASGGIRSLKAVDEDTARLGQQLVIAGLKGPDSQPASSRMKCASFDVEQSGPALVQAVTRGEILGPGDRLHARFLQRFRLWAGRPLLEIEVGLSDLDPTWLARLAEDDPWSQYLACRWAWPDPASMLRRTVLLAPELTESDRPETPDALDVSTRRQRTSLLFGGLAHHRRHGTRMLDTLLVAGRDSAREFRLGVALDQEYPFHAATDLIAPAYVVPTEAGPPATGPTGWLFHLDARAAAVTRVDYVESTGEGRGWGLAFHMLETAGLSVRCRLRTFRSPSSARQTDFQGSVIVELSTEGDAVLVDLTPHELARVEVTLG